VLPARGGGDIDFHYTSCHNEVRKGVRRMRCEYKDGMKIDYSGFLRMTKGEDVNVYLGAGDIPKGLKSDLDFAARHKSCGELRTVAEEVTATVGSKLPE